MEFHKEWWKYIYKGLYKTYSLVTLEYQTLKSKPVIRAYKKHIQKNNITEISASSYIDYFLNDYKKE